MFSAALGLIGGIGSIIMGGQQYALGMQELALKREALNQQRDFGMLNYGLALDQLAMEKEQTEYVKEYNRRNELNQAIERAKIEGQRKQRLAAYQAERQYVVDRQVQIDKAQAEQYALELEAYLRNTNLAKEERETALAYLDSARQVASGERDEDLIRLRMERLTAQQERDFAIGELRNAQAIAAGERVDDLNYRDRIMAQLSEMGEALQTAYSGMGALYAPAGPSEEEIASTVSRYENNAISNVDRAADRVASQAEASLIDSGMARSTAGEMRRAEVARKLALDYDNARLAARNQAMAYITGKEGLKDQAFQRQVAARGRTFEEISSVYAPIIQGLTQNRGALSANAYQAPVGIGTGNVIRDVKSANQYAAPIGVGSSIFAPTGMSSRMGATLNMPSVADAYVITGDYNQFQPQMWNLTGPAPFMSNASSLIGSIAQQYTPATYMQMGMDQMGAGFSAIGGAMVDLSRSSTYRPPAANPYGAMGAQPAVQSTPGWNGFNPWMR
jgi:hypothetical protein